LRWFFASYSLSAFLLQAAHHLSVFSILSNQQPLEPNSSPVAKPDGRELYYLGPDGKIMAVAVKTDPTFQAVQTVELFQTPLAPVTRPLGRRYAVSANGQRFLFAPQLTPSVAGDSASITVFVNWTSAIMKK